MRRVLRGAAHRVTRKTCSTTIDRAPGDRAIDEPEALRLPWGAVPTRQSGGALGSRTTEQLSEHDIAPKSAKLHGRSVVSPRAFATSGKDRPQNQCSSMALSVVRGDQSQHSRDVSAGLIAFHAFSRWNHPHFVIALKSASGTPKLVAKVFNLDVHCDREQPRLHPLARIEVEASPVKAEESLLHEVFRVLGRETGFSASFDRGLAHIEQTAL